MKRIVLLILLILGLIGILGWYINDQNNNKPALITNNPTIIQPNKDKSTSDTFNKSLYSIDEPTSVWIVVNKSRPLNPLSYTPTDLYSVGNGQYLRKSAAQALATLIVDAKKQGLHINPLSGYRSYQTQVRVYGNEVLKYGQQIADTESAKPGYSEHQTGWAIDVGGGGCGIEDCFGKTAEGMWLATNAYKYGFIVRYTAAKQSITGYRAEPWHIRYIGQELASEMHKTGQSTLEEFFGL